MMIGLFALPQAVCFASAAWLFSLDKWQGWPMIVVGLLSAYSAEWRK